MSLAIQCEVCELAKHHRTSFSKSIYKSTEPFTIHSNFWGPSRIPSWTHTNIHKWPYTTSLGLFAKRQLRSVLILSIFTPWSKHNSIQKYKIYVPKMVMNISLEFLCKDWPCSKHWFYHTFILHCFTGYRWKLTYRGGCRKTAERGGTTEFGKIKKSDHSMCCSELINFNKLLYINFNFNFIFTST